MRRVIALGLLNLSLLLSACALPPAPPAGQSASQQEQSDANVRRELGQPPI